MMQRSKDTHTAIVSNERGVIAFIAMALVLLLTTIGIVALQTSNDEITLAGNERSELRAFYAAEAGLERAVSIIQAEYMATTKPPASMPTGTIDLNDASVEYHSVDNGPAELRDITTGALAGLYTQMKTFDMNATGIDEVNNSTVTLSETFQVSLIPLFQFAIFYANEMELHPGPDMTLVGRVHSNGDMYLGTNSTLNMDSYVTSAGHIFHGRDAASGLTSGTGSVNIKNTSGVYEGMFQSGSWLDANDANWYDSSVSRWGGRVEDEAHGMEPLNLPLTGSASGPHVIVERDNGGANPDSYENQAGLKIINQKVYKNVSGVWVDATVQATTEGWFTTVDNSFQDYREGEDVDVVEIDVDGFKSSTLFPSNGIVYSSDKATGHDYPALQLKNGADIGNPITWVSENPIYVEGDYNTVGKQPSAFIGDAITFLSNDWDSHKNQPNKTDRKADKTVVNASFVTGNVPSSSGNYSGGVENLPRFLEDWSGVDFVWRGSMINLWESEQATAKWGGGYYNPPNRDWAFDTDLDDPANLPPGTPVARNFARIGWSQDDVSYSQAPTN